MKIVLINNLYGSYQRGGAEKIVKEMYENFTKDNHKTSIITTLPYFKKGKKEKNTYYIKSFYYHLNKIPFFLRLFWHLGEFLSFRKYKTIKTILKKEDPDLIITHNLVGLGKLSFIAIRKSNKKHFHILHDIQLIHPSGLMILGEEKKINTSLSKIYYKINKKIIKSPEAVISPSKWLLDMHTNLGFFNNSNKKIIPNPINLNDFKKEKLNSRRFNLLFAGQIEHHKGIKFLLEAFKEINKNKNLKNKISLSVAGEGTELEKYKKLYKDENNLKFLGWLNERKLEEEFKRTNIVIVPSICYENSPTIIYQAINFEIPVLASNIGGTPELITNQKEQLFKPADSLDLYNKIKKAFYNYKDLKNKTSTNKEKIEELNSENYSNKIVQLFKRTKENKT
jgi:glycosyltransferase involved in cell wall biosynthesis